MVVAGSWPSRCSTEIHPERNRRSPNRESLPEEERGHRDRLGLEAQLRAELRAELVGIGLYFVVCTARVGVPYSRPDEGVCEPAEEEQAYLFGFHRLEFKIHGDGKAGQRVCPPDRPSRRPR